MHVSFLASQTRALFFVFFLTLLFPNWLFGFSLSCLSLPTSLFLCSLSLSHIFIPPPIKKKKITTTTTIFLAKNLRVQQLLRPLDPLADPVAARTRLDSEGDQDAQAASASQLSHLSELTLPSSAGNPSREGGARLGTCRSRARARDETPPLCPLTHLYCSSFKFCLISLSDCPFFVFDCFISRR